MEETKMLDSISNQEILTTKAWQFDTELVPLQIENGTIVDTHKALIRTDTEEVLAVHGNGYQIISHDDVVNSTYDAIKRADISNDFNFKVTDYENGRKLKIDIIFPDLTIEPQVGDYVRFQGLVYNSYDATWALSQAARGLRLWCDNGCTTPDTISHQRTKHTKNGAIGLDSGAYLFKQGLENFFNNKEKWQSYANIRINPLQAEGFFKEELVKSNRKYKDHNEFNKKQLENLLSIHQQQNDQLGWTLWALYNTMTYWATHTDDCAMPENTRRNRSALIAKAMRSNHWRIYENSN